MKLRLQRVIFDENCQIIIEYKTYIISDGKTVPHNEHHFIFNCIHIYHNVLFVSFDSMLFTHIIIITVYAFELTFSKHIDVIVFLILIVINKNTCYI